MKKLSIIKNVQKIVGILDDSMLILDSKDYSESTCFKNLEEKIQSNFFEQCIEMCRHANTTIKEPIRTIHHLSCTGGTIITKCLAAMPNILVLNEIDPLSTMNFKQDNPDFSPTDIFSLLRQGDDAVSMEILHKLFIENLKCLYGEYNLLGKRLLLRDHSHSHYLVGSEITARPCMLKMIKKSFMTASVLTVRDPIDSYLSLINNDTWNFFEPALFDEYCRRYLVFLEDYKGVPILKYEDFVENPKEFMKKSCGYLELKYVESFIDTFDAFVFSGDSGRKGNIIMPRKRRDLSPHFHEEILTSQFYEKLRHKLGYKRALSV